MVTSSEAKNGEKTCALNGKHFHSAYNPSREAEQYVLRLEIPFNPAAIIIIEPAFSYCARFLRNRFPEAALCAIRLCADFSEYDHLWDYSFYTDTTPALSEQLFSALGEENLCSALFFAWPPAEQIFLEKTKSAWQEIKSAVLKSRDVLATRSFFAKRWLKNTVRFCYHIRHTAIIKKGDADIVIAASGPSLTSSLPKIKEHRNEIFLIAVSSALLPLLHAKIQPDVVISTDGGWWAKKHLSAPGYDVSALVFACAAEGAVHAELAAQNTIVPLYYDDGIEKEFFTVCKINAMSATRNGTVSGTAAEFALALTSGNVYFCGLDLSPAKGFQHTQPNALELLNEAKDFRLNPKSTRMAASECASQGSLEIYRNWFAAQSERLGKRLFRLSDNYKFSHTLGKIQDITWNDFSVRHKKDGFTLPKIIRTKPSANGRAEKLFKAIHTVFSSDKYISELCPVESMMEKRTTSKDEQKKYALTIAEKKERCIEELEKQIYG